MDGNITAQSKPSAYQANEDVGAFMAKARADYALGEDIIHKTRIELNTRSVIQDENRGLLMFNAFVDESVDDPADAWKWRGTRSLARNKGIDMHANLTANYLLPLFVAQNDDDEQEVEFSEAMRDIVEWMAAPSNSNYQEAFMQVTLGALTSPVIFMGAEYNEIFQKIREKQADGSYTVKEILDEVLSGFSAPVWSCTQVLIVNAYERNIQKQRRVIKRRWAEMSELEAQYGHLDNWQYVTPGWRSVYSSEDGVFYDVKDRAHTSRWIVSEETVMCRKDDSEVMMVNGIPMIEGNIEDNPIRHRDNRGAPKYNVVPFGYHRIGTDFFYYKSMMNAIGWDNSLYDAQTEVFMNRAFLEAEMPIAISGSDQIDSEVVFPGSVVTMEDPNSKATNLLPNGNLNALAQAMKMTKDSVDDATTDPIAGGQVPTGSPTAYSIAQAQQNARKMIGAAAKSVAESVVKYGDLMKDIAISHVTAPQAQDMIGGQLGLKYRSFLIDGKGGPDGGASRVVKLDPELIGASMTPAEKKAAEVSLAISSGYPNRPPVK